jgi:hypothetical protein
VLVDKLRADVMLGDAGQGVVSIHCVVHILEVVPEVIHAQEQAVPVWLFRGVFDLEAFFLGCLVGENVV